MPEIIQKRPRIAVIRTSSIGDVVLASACLDLAARIGVDIVWLGREPALSLLQSGWPNVSFFTIPQSLAHLNANFFKELGPVQAIVDLQTNLRSRALLRLFRKRGVPSFSANKNQRRRYLMIAFARIRQRIAPTHTQQVPEIYRQYKEMLNAFAKACAHVGINPTDLAKHLAEAKPNLSGICKTTVSTPWSHELGFGEWIAIAPGASYPTKQAPTSIWIEALATFLQVRGDTENCGLLIAGNEADRKVAVELLDQINWQGPVLNMAGKLSLVETAQALAKVRVLLTNDSGLLHIAESVGTPVIAVFGPTTEQFGFPPWRDESYTFSSPTGCRPCSKHGKKTCRYGDKLCFEAINTLAIGTATHILASASKKLGAQS